MKRRKRIYLILVFLLIVGSFTGCGNSGDDGHIPPIEQRTRDRKTSSVDTDIITEASGSGSTITTEVGGSDSNSTDEGSSEQDVFNGVDGPEIMIGDTITFGRYPQTAQGDINPLKWQVLDVQGDKALIISKYGLEKMKFNDRFVNTTWEDCSIRTWLNVEFQNAAFTDEERELIVETTLDNNPNPIYFDARGCGKTEDKIFLLSLEETQKYFNLTINNGEMLKQYYCYGDDFYCIPTEYVEPSGITYYNNGDENYVTCMWWLRSPGSDNYNYSYAEKGSVMANGLGIDSDYIAVRPALWVRINGLSSADIAHEGADPLTEMGIVEDTSLPDLSSVAIGDTIEFGKIVQDESGIPKSIEWQVLDVRDGKALIISKYGLYDAQYNLKDEDVTWETCSLRASLNGDFYYNIFTKTEQSIIEDTMVVTPGNPNGVGKGGNDTIDKIFLLSMDEAVLYFKMTKSDEEGNVYAYGDGCNCYPVPTTNATAGGWYEESEECWWWLRSPGQYNSYGTIAVKGKIEAYGPKVDSYAVMVRPAMWIRTQ